VDGVGERAGVVVGPPPAKDLAELGVGARLLVQQRPAGGEHGVEVDPLDLAAEGAAGPEVPFQHRPQQRVEGQAVAGGDQVQGGAHERAADGPSLADQPAQLVRVEALKSRPQPDIGVPRFLGLHAHQVLDRVGGGPSHPAQQQLALEQRAVERPLAERVR
jgi:hypothetical protein